MSADSHALATISARPMVTMTFVVETAVARQAANANGSNSRRLIEAEVSLSLRSHRKGVCREVGPKLQPNKLNRWTSTRLAAIEVSCFAQIPGAQRRNPMLTDTPSQCVRVIQFNLLNRHPSGCPVGPKRVGRKEVPCKFLQFCRASRGLVSYKG